MEYTSVIYFQSRVLKSVLWMVAFDCYPVMKTLDENASHDINKTYHFRQKWTNHGTCVESGYESNIGAQLMVSKTVL